VNLDPGRGAPDHRGGPVDWSHPVEHEPGPRQRDGRLETQRVPASAPAQPRIRNDIGTGAGGGARGRPRGAGSVGLAGGAPGAAGSAGRGAGGEPSPERLLCPGLKVDREPSPGIARDGRRRFDRPGGPCGVRAEEPVDLADHLGAVRATVGRAPLERDPRRGRRGERGLCARCPFDAGDALPQRERRG
jgi:hypothetical protein